jgi:hypothetical protein
MSYDQKHFKFAFITAYSHTGIRILYEDIWETCPHFGSIPIDRMWEIFCDLNTLKPDNIDFSYKHEHITIVFNRLLRLGEYDLIEDYFEEFIEACEVELEFQEMMTKNGGI